mmetsp:Transcript_30315/g.90342  ORF Transcript_30315/g.90342 Transcript_30315/m.90342 type:complete len:112 (+) Transcript_30315:898-1233(+)
MDRVFSESEFNHPSIKNWNVTSATTMIAMFSGASSFNQDLTSWSSSIVSLVDGRQMFYGAESFNTDLCAWGDTLENTGVNLNNMFLDTACPFKDRPNFNSAPPGPFCFQCD